MQIIFIIPDTLRYGAGGLRRLHPSTLRYGAGGFSQIIVIELIELNEFIIIFFSGN
jgi:hypothetical protein